MFFEFICYPAAKGDPADAVFQFYPLKDSSLPIILVPMNTFKPKLIHIAKIAVQNQGPCLLLLRQIEPFRYIWFKENQPGVESETEIWGGTAEEAIREATKNWQLDEFQPVNCGFRYTLPERDEVGTNALFHQMASSYGSMNGVYFDDELSSNCIVQNASAEARLLWKRLQK